MSHPFMLSFVLSLSLLSPVVMLHDCNPPVDADGDGYTADEDCNDQDPTIHPDQMEPCVCDDIDQNCNGIPHDFPCDMVCPEQIDQDGDGYPVDKDCDDTNPKIHPDQEEPCDCNGIDENCNGVADDLPCDIACPDGGDVGDPCGGDYGECKTGLVCCYPCGIPDCGPNICHVPCDDEWCAGGCPLYP